MVTYAQPRPFPAGQIDLRLLPLRQEWERKECKGLSDILFAFCDMVIKLSLRNSSDLLHGMNRFKVSLLGYPRTFDEGARELYPNKETWIGQKEEKQDCCQ